MDQAILRKVQNVQLDIVLEIDRICKKNDITYFLAGGSALGAIRHNGFIPWDDDLDIAMLRQDYERFKEACSLELSEDYFYQDGDADLGYGYPFAKIRVKNTVYEEQCTAKSNENKGIFVDIFPYDNVAPTKKEEEKRKRKYYSLYRIVLAKTGYTPVESNVKKKIAYFLARYFVPISLKNARRKLKEIMVCDIIANDFVVDYAGAYGYEKEVIERKWISDVIETSFEGYTLPVPKEFDSYLSHLYGEYMVLPPVEKRGDRHSIIRVDFGDYQIKYNFRQ